MMHRLLERQLKRLIKSGVGVEGCDPLIELVDKTYSEFDTTISRIQRSLDLSSEELRLRNEDLRAVFQVFPDLFIWLDDNGQIVDMRGGAVGVFSELKRRDFAGQKVWKSGLVDNPGPLQSMFEERKVTVHEFVLTRGREKIWCEIRMAPAEFGKTVLAVRDITDLKKKSKELERAEEKFRSIFENATEGISIIGINGNLIEVNQAFADMFGYDSPEHIVSEISNIRKQMYVNPDDRDVLLDGLLSNGVVDQLELEWLHKNGSVVWVAINARLAVKGGKTWIEGVVRDITKRRKAEIALQEAKALLEKRVTDRTVQLTKANEDLQQTHEELKLAMERAESANRMKTEFLANMSHEIRTPMNAILGLSELVLKSTINEGQRENVEGIYSSGETLLKIINDILDISKIEAGKLNITEEVVDLHSLLGEVTSIVMLGSRGDVTITLDKSNQLPQYIITDRTRLHQVLNNLLNNAIKFTREGFVTLRVHHILDVSQVTGCRIIFSVQDTGVGISKEQRDRIFEPFHQVDASVSRPFGGTGLGLSISQKLVQLLGGEGIDLVSEPGKGAEFSFSLPAVLADEVQDQRGNDEQISLKILKNLSVLVAEDWELNRHLLEQILHSLNIRDITCVVNGEEAVDAAVNNNFSLILMDVQMPVMGGIEATREIRKKGITVPIIALTAHAMEDDKIQCLQAGMNDYLSKPYRMEEIASSIQKFI